jgi:hypothetical protein
VSLRKSLAPLAAATAAVALAVPMASASAATTVPALPVTPTVVGGLLAPGSLPCVLLIQQVRFAVLTGNTVWSNFLSNAFVRSGCGGAAI